MPKEFRLSPLKAAVMALMAFPIVAAALTVWPSEAGAYSKRVERACKSDYKRHCPHYKVRTPQMRSCMRLAGRRGNLSPRCIDALTDAGLVPRKYRRRR